MAVDVFINFNGNCREAVKFYTQVFDAENSPIMTFGDAPPDLESPLPEATKNLIMYTSLNINGSIVMFSDCPPGTPFVAGSNIVLTISIKDKEKIRSLFNKLKEGGTVHMDLQETFFSKLYGLVVDKFGIHWNIMHDSEPTNL